VAWSHFTRVHGRLACPLLLPSLRHPNTHRLAASIRPAARPHSAVACLPLSPDLPPPPPPPPCLPPQARVLLPPRSLQVMNGPARYRYTHAIACPDLLDARRVSLTFRQSPLRPQ